MKDYSKSDIWNTDETSVFYQDLGRSTFAPRDHVGCLVQNEKKRITALQEVAQRFTAGRGSEALGSNQRVCEMHKYD